MGVEVYVGQIADTVTEDELKKLFSIVGTVESVHIVKDSETGKYRGCGYVRMSSDEEAKESIDFLNGTMLGDRLIVVRNVPKKVFKNSCSSGSSRNAKDIRTGKK
jgi:RNA recognition motif-containing protein